jgi:DNA-3-methyladenine glycosylase I
MATNAAWHAQNSLPRGATDPERLRWHLAHQRACGCRPIPARLVVLGDNAAKKIGGPTTAPAASNANRCTWATSDPLYIRYHDEEWGVPSHEDRHLFEMLILEGAQAGLSWITILRKRDNYRRAFDEFDVRRVARYDSRKVASLLADEGIVRNRLKIASTIDNARATIEVQKEFGSLDQFLWSFVDGKPIVRRPRSMKDVPPRSAESDVMSKALKKRGFRFVGSTICYAFMQACGLVNDHVATCYRAPKAR